MSIFQPCVGVFDYEAHLSSPSRMTSLLTDRQRSGLNKAVVQYLGSQNVSQHIIADISKELGLDSGSSSSDEPQSLGLERKWLAVVRLQKRILELETQLGDMQAAAREPIAKDGVWLPRQPAQHVMMGHRQPVTSVAFHPVWSIVASGSEDGSIKVWDWESGELERTLKAHIRGVLGVSFGACSGPKALMASCSSDLSVKIWDPGNEFANTRTFVGHDHTVSDVAFLPPHDQLVASCSRDKTIRIWQLETGYCIRIIKGHTEWVRSLAPSYDGTYIVSVGSDKTARLAATIAGQAIGMYGRGMGSQDDGADQLVFYGHDHVIECCVVAPASASQHLAKLEGVEQPVETKYSSSINYFATGSRDKTIIIWNMRQEIVARLKGHDNWVRGLVFHPNGRYLLSVSDDKTMRIWDLETGKQTKSIVAHDHFVTSIALSNSKVVATGSIDLTVKTWA